MPPPPDQAADSGAATELAPAADQTADATTGEPGDSFDAILRRVVQPPESSLLESGSELAGRFKIARVLGSGGMGTVYAARDATLGRDVAIKLHHAANGAPRLRREAMAMARLAHPNVVAVFEVGDLDGRPFVVMEYIAGTTLRAHLAERRGVRDALALLLAAGEGLAAAHDAGLVHRDFKPENVLVGSDGRPRVGDFGLARELEAGAPEGGAGEASEAGEAAAASALALGSGDELRGPVTQTGAVLGTPAYMAPEQFAGAPVDARADQFAFCVTAWEALWGERPFAGSTYVQLAAAIGLGERRAPPAQPRVPARIRAALERGLAVDPAERFPSMRALLAAIRPRGRRLGRWLAAGAALVAAGIAAALIAGGERAPSCDAAGAAELAGVRGDLPGLLARGTPEIARRVEALQRDHAARFGGEARRACEAEAAHQWSPDIVARSRLCFAVVGRTAQLLLASADPARPLDVLRRVRRLPPEEHCANPNHLASRPAIPSDPARLAALIEANALLAIGLDAIEDRELAALRRALGSIEASPARGEPGIAAGQLVLRGWLALDGGRIAEARQQLADAYYAGRAIDDEQIAGAALGLLIEHGADLEIAADAQRGWQRTALADADRVRARSPWLAGRMYMVAARAADQAQNAPTALALVARAREVLDPGDPVRTETYATEGAVLMWSGRVDDGMRAYQAAIAQRIAYAGAADPELASLLSDYASSLLDAQRLDDALAAADRAAQIIAGAPDPDDARIDPIRITLAAVLIGADRDDEAMGLLATARAHAVRRGGETSALVAGIDTNLAAIYTARGEADRAIAALRSALATDEKLLGPDRLEVASAAYNLAAALRDRGDAPAAIASALRASEIFAAKAAGSDRHRLALTLAASAANDAGDPAQALALTATALGFARPAESPQTAAWAQLERGRALIGLHRAAEARPLLDAARAAYAELRMSARVHQADELLARPPAR